MEVQINISKMRDRDEQWSAWGHMATWSTHLEIDTIAAAIRCWSGPIFKIIVMYEACISSHFSKNIKQQGLLKANCVIE